MDLRQKEKGGKGGREDGRLRRHFFPLARVFYNQKKRRGRGVGKRGGKRKKRGKNLLAINVAGVKWGKKKRRWSA